MPYNDAMDSKGNIFSFFLDACDRYGDRTVFVERKKYRRKVWSYKATRDRVSQLAQFLKSKNLKKGDKIIICAPNSHLWACLFFACAGEGIIVVPLDSNSAPEFIKKIIMLTEARCIFFSKHLPQALIDFPATKIYFEELESGLDQFSKDSDLTNTGIHPQDTLEIVFSSGSTGEPKGVVLSHKNVCFNLYALAKVVSLDSKNKLLSIIPLSHMFEQTAGLFSPILWGATIVYLRSIKPINILRTLKEEKISSVVCVPAFLQILRNAIIRELSGMDKIGIPRLFFRKIIRSGIRNRLGNNLKEFYVGGAPLDKDLEIFWNDLGILLLQGYGMTETAPLVTANSRNNHKLHSVGKLLPGIEIKLDHDGEILIKGLNVSGGYYKNPEATKSSFHEGWVRSGDIGEFDKEKFLYIRGRKKSVIIGSSGMKIYPEDIEAILREDPNVRDAVVCGIDDNSRLIIKAAIVPSNKNITTQEIAKRANGRLASHQRIQEISIWPHEDFPRTPTKKVIRDEVCKYLEGVQTTPHTYANQQNKTTSDPIIKVLIEVTGFSSDKITPNSNLVTDLRLDSIKRLELASRIEEELGIELDESSIDYNSTVNDLEKIVANTQRNKKGLILPKWPMFNGVVFLRRILQNLTFLFLKIFQSIQVIKNRNIAYPTPAILIANHQSHLDALSVIGSLPNSYRSYIAVAAAKDYFFTNKIAAFFARLFFNAFPLDREGNMRESLTIIGKLLDAGQSVLIFPEGTRTTTGKIQPFKNGIGVIAQEMEVPIVPIKISGNFEILPKDKILPKRGKTLIKIGEPLTFPPNNSYIAITEKLQEILKTL